MGVCRTRRPPTLAAGQPGNGLRHPKSGRLAAGATRLDACQQLLCGFSDDPHPRGVVQGAHIGFHIRAPVLGFQGVKGMQELVLVGDTLYHSFGPVLAFA